MRWQDRPIRIDWFLVLLLVSLALVARLLPGERIVDDAYITFRYARNIVEGHGFVYNPGEQVLGTTTPLYTVLLAGVAFLTRSQDFPTIAVTVNALAGAASVGLLYALGRRVIGNRVPAAAAALLWAVAPHSVTFAVGGMETDLTIALLLAATYAYAIDAPYPLAVLSGLSLLARPDAALLLLPLWLGLALNKRRIPLREGGVALAVIAPWLIFATLTFGSPLPASVAAKSAAYRLPPRADLVRLIQHYSTPFFAHELIGSAWQLAGFIIYLLLTCVAGLRAIRRDAHVWPLLIYPYLYFAVFAVANPLLFRWYLSPPLPFYILFILAGVCSVARALAVFLVGRLPRRVNRLGDGREGCALCDDSKLSRLVRSGLPALFTVLALASTLNAWELHPDHGPDRPAPEMAWFELELLYHRAASLVLDHAQPGDTLCAGDIGTLGYVTDMRILDAVGLVTPEARRYYPADKDLYVTNYAIPPDLVVALDPDFIVALEVYGRRGLLPHLTPRYRRLAKFETNIYGSDGMLVFQRRN